MLEERLNDINEEPAEDVRVRRMTAIALGRMKANDALPSLRKHMFSREPVEDPVNNACRWAIIQLTGEAMLPPTPIRKVQGGWFLVPYEEREKQR